MKSLIIVMQLKVALIWDRQKVAHILASSPNPYTVMSSESIMFLLQLHHGRPYFHALGVCNTLSTFLDVCPYSHVQGVYNGLSTFYDVCPCLFFCNHAFH